MQVVVGDKKGTYLEDVFLRLPSFGQGAFEEFVDAVAYHELVGRFVVCRKAQLAEGMVSALCQVGNSIQQGAVQIEYYQFFHR